MDLARAGHRQGRLPTYSCRLASDVLKLASRLSESSRRPVHYEGNFASERAVGSCVLSERSRPPAFGAMRMDSRALSPSWSPADSAPHLSGGTVRKTVCR